MQFSSLFTFWMFDLRMMYNLIGTIILFPNGLLYKTRKVKYYKINFYHIFFLLFHPIFIFAFVGDGSSIFPPSWNSDRSFLSVLASLEVDTAAMDWESDSFSLHFKSQQFTLIHKKNILRILFYFKIKHKIIK